MVVQLSSLRVTADMDASPYVAGMAQKVAADRAAADSSTRTGAAFQRQNQQLEVVGTGLARISRQYIDGYGTAEKFSKAVAALGAELDRNGEVPLTQVSAALEGIYRKYGLAADASQLMLKGQVALAAVVTELNTRLSVQAEAAERLAIAKRRISEADAAQAQINANLGVRSDFGTDARAEDIAAYGSELDRLRAKYVPLVAAQQQYRATLTEIQQAYRTGVFTNEREYQQAIQKTKDSFAAQVVAIRTGTVANDTHADSSRRASHESGQLALQLNDVFTSIAGGISPMQTLIQQGPQITQIYGGVGATFARIKDALGAIPPVALAATAAFVAITAPLTLAVAKAIELEKQLRQVRTALAATGNASGMNASDVQAQVIAAARLPLLDTESASAAAEVLLRNPLINGEMFRRLLPIAGELAKVMGKDVPGAVAEMVSAMTDGATGAQRLFDQYRLLTAVEKEQVRQLEQHGDRLGAMMLVMTAAERRADEMRKVGVSPLAQAAKALGNAWDELMKSMARTSIIQGAVGAMTQLLSIAKGVLDLDLGKIAQFVGLMNPATAPAVLAGIVGMSVANAVAANGSSLQEQIDAKKRERDQADRDLQNIEQRRLMLPPQSYETAKSQASQRVQQLGAELVDLQRKADAAGKSVDGAVSGKPGAGPGKSEIERQADEANKLVQRYREVAEKRAEIEKNIGTLQTRMEAGQFGEKGSKRYNEAAEALAKMRGELATTLTYDEQLTKERREQAEIDKAAPALREAVRAGQEAYNRAIREGKTEQQAAAISREEYSRALRRSTEGSARAFEALSLEAKANLAVADAYLKSGDAVAAYTEAVRQAQIAEARGEQLGASPEEYARRQFEGQVSGGVKDSAARISALKMEADSLNRVADAERQSSAAGEDVARREQFMTGLVKLRTMAELTKNDALIKAVDDIIPAYIEASDKLAAAERRRQAIAASRQYDPTVAYRDEVDRIERLAKTGDLTVKAEIAMREEAYSRMARAGDSWLQGATAGLMEFARTAQNVGQVAADAIVQGFSVATDAAARLMLGMSVNIKSALADIKLSIVRGLIQSNITGPIAGYASNLLGSIGIGPGTAGAGGGGGSSGLGDLLGIGRLFSGGDSGSGPGSVFGFLGDRITNSAGDWSTLGAGMYGPPSPNMGALGSMTWGQGLAGIGSIGMGVFNMAQGNTIGGGAGILGGAMGLLGAAVPSLGFLGPIGMGIGLIGGLLGGLLKKKPATPQGVTDLQFGADGWFSSTAMSRGKGNLSAGTGKASDALGDQLDQLATAYGLSFAQDAIGGWILNSQGKNTGDQWITGLGTYGSYTPLPGGYDNFTNSGTSISALGSADEAIGLLASMIFKANAGSGALTGLSGTQRTILTNADLESIEDIKSALDFSQTYDDIVRGQDNITAAEKAIRDLNTQFRALSQQAKDYGLDTAIIEQRRKEAINRMATDMNDDYRRRLLGMTPEGQMQVALEDIDRAREQALKEAAEINSSVTGALVNINQIEEFYSKQRLQIIEQANQAATASIQELWKRLSYGDLSGASPITGLTGTKSEYERLLAEAQGGSMTAQGQVAAAAEAYIRAQAAYSGNNSDFEAVRLRILADIAPWVAANGNSPAAQQFNNNVVQMSGVVIAMQNQIDTLAAMFAQSQAENAALRAEMRRVVNLLPQAA